MKQRKCCATPKGSGPHSPKCRNNHQAQFLSLPVEARKAVFLEVAEDLPDGAFWAMAEDFGLDQDDFLDDAK